MRTVALFSFLTLLWSSGLAIAQQYEGMIVRHVRVHLVDHGRVRVAGQLGHDVAIHPGLELAGDERVPEHVLAVAFPGLLLDPLEGTFDRIPRPLAAPGVFEDGPTGDASTSRRMISMLRSVGK